MSGISTRNNRNAVNSVIAYAPHRNESEQTMEHPQAYLSAGSGADGAVETTETVGRTLTPPERETTINASDADELVRIWTAQRTYITKMRNNPAFTEVKSGMYGTSAWAQFTIPADRWSPLGVKRQLTLTDAQRAAMSNRMKALRR
jgi:multidrug efflux pump subunit AcrB